MSDFANKLRPQSLDEIVGQSHIINLLKKMVEKNHLTSLILYGKPGIGKTSVAYALCNEFKLSYSYFNAATGNKKQLEEHLKISDVIIIDEIHRLNKDKQDVLLPKLERQKVKIIATTTENPFFTVVPALRSRTHILELKNLSVSEIAQALKKANNKLENKLNISQNLLEKIARHSNGDYRFALNSLNLISRLYGKQKINEKIIKNVIPSMHFYSDKQGDGHYNLLSAFHKSLRGSDIDAALYYLAQLINSGDLIGIERRMIMVAYEDIGFADPNLSLRISQVLQNANKVGFPEARIILSFGVMDLCKAKKSNSAYKSIAKAQQVIQQKGVFDMPSHLKDAHYASAKKLGNGTGYKYPHDFGGHVEQQYLPDEIKDIKIYQRNPNDKI